jgi:hypothetical protein
VAKLSARRSERLKRELDAVVPPPPSAEETRQEAEAFLNNWAHDIVKAAHHARDLRARGEPIPRPVGQMSGLEVCAEAVSYNGHPPPEDVRHALYKLTHERESANIPAEMTQMMNDATKAALSLAFARFAEETKAAHGEGGNTPR